MKSSVLIVSALLAFAGAASAQTSAKKIGVLPYSHQNAQTVDYRSFLKAQEEASLSGESATPPTYGAPAPDYSSAKTSAVNTIKIGTASNALTIINSRMNSVFAHDGLQMIGWAHRQNIQLYPPMGGVPPAVASGLVRYDLSLDGGQTFPASQIDLGVLNTPPFNVVGNPRYPQGTVYLPPGAQTAEEARLVWTSPLSNGSGWGAYQYGVARNLPGFGNNPSNFQSPNATSGITENPYTKDQFLPGGLCQGKPGEFWMFDNSVQLINTTNYTRDSLQLWKGTISADNNSIDWKLYKVFRPGTFRTDANGNSLVGNTNIAFSPDGKWGWACATANLMVPGKESYFESTPLLYYTNDGGDTWDGPIYVWNRDLPAVTNAIYTRYLNAAGDTLASTSIPVTTEFDITVDANGNPHIFCFLLNASSATPAPDSLGYVMPGLNKVMFDITTFDHGQTWCPQLVSYTRTWRGALNDDQTAAAFVWTNYLQASRTETGNHIFYSWIDDVNAANVSLMHPNLFDRAFRITDQAMTVIHNRTYDDPTFANRVYFPSVSPTVLTRPNDEYLMPTVFLQFTATQNDPCNFYFINDRTYQEGDFLPPGFFPDTVYSCGGSVTLTTNYTDAVSIKWFKNDVELTQYFNQPSITVDQNFIGNGVPMKVVVDRPNCNNLVVNDVFYLKNAVLPQADPDFVNAQTCDSVLITATQNPNYSVDWYFDSVLVAVNVSSLYADTIGLYTARITDLTTNCQADYSITVSAWNITASLPPTQDVCAPFWIDAANTSAPDSSGAIFKWYVTGDANGQTYNNELMQEGPSSKFNVLLNAAGTPITYKVVISDPLGCSTSTATTSVTAYGQIQAKWKLETMVDGADVTAKDSIKVCCGTFIKMTDLSEIELTAQTGRYWRFVPLAGPPGPPQMIGSPGSPQTMGSPEIQAMWPCTRKGPKLLSLYVRSGECIDTLAKRIEVVDTPCVVRVSDKFVTALEQMSVYPNPSQGVYYVNLRFKQPEPVTLSVYDINGKEVLVETHEGKNKLEVRLNLSALPAGIYVLKAQTPTANLSQRIVKF